MKGFVGFLNHPTAGNNFFHQTKHGQVMGEQNWKKRSGGDTELDEDEAILGFSLDDILEVCNTKIPVDVSKRKKICRNCKPKLLQG